MAFRREDGLSSRMVPRAGLFVALADMARHHGVRVDHRPRCTRPALCARPEQRGGDIPDFHVDVPPGEFRMQFGTRAFFALMNTPDGGTILRSPMIPARRGEISVLPAGTCVAVASQ